MTNQTSFEKSPTSEVRGVQILSSVMETRLSRRKKRWASGASGWFRRTRSTSEHWMPWSDRRSRRCSRHRESGENASSTRLT